jgi:acyl carrier protein
MYNKVVLSVVQNVLSVYHKPLNRNTDFKSLGATSSELNWLMFETERRLKVQLPETAITADSTIKDLLKTVVVNLPFR